MKIIFKAIEYKCEECDSVVGMHDKFCRECGKNLEKVEYERQVTRSASSESVFDIIGSVIKQ